MPLKKKDHYKKKDLGIYGKVNKPSGKSKRNYKISKPVAPKKAKTDPVKPIKQEPIKKENPVVQPVAQQTAEIKTSAAKTERVEQYGLKTAAKPVKKTSAQKSSDSSKNMLPQLVFATVLGGIGLALLVCTTLLVYQPMQKTNKDLAETRLKARMELSTLISEVLPSMGVDDELSDMILRSLENQEAKFKKESEEVADQLEQLKADSVINDFLTDIQYRDKDFHDIIADEEDADACLQIIGGKVGEIDAKLEELGVAVLKQEIAALKGTTTTVTREDENGEMITETVVQGGLIAEEQAKKDELQKQFDEINGKLTQMEEYLAGVDHKITAMYNRLETDKKPGDLYAKMQAITEYVKQNPTDNIFMQDTAEKLASFPGESREEDDILFIAKIESETGIRMPYVSFGQDYMLTKLSNGMLLCYEVYSIPYYATYQGLKNLIAYFNENEDFYASIYTLSMFYDPMTKSIQGEILIMHYYLLEEDAEYVPPVLDEEITPGIDGIFGENTDNGKPNGPLSSYTPEDIEEWLDSGMSLEEVRKEKLSKYPETELLWILKKKYKTEDDIKGFLERYGDPEVDYNDRLELVFYLKELFPNTDPNDLMDIYYAELPEEDDSGDDTTGDENTGDDTTGGENTGGENTGDGTTGEENNGNENTGDENTGDDTQPQE